ncbi:hypothetical protein G9A89_021657 [Geosiphon pyriformis]|nr:hypothetical protein G9A89_021657 [Geosiphon pyriformis]
MSIILDQSTVAAEDISTQLRNISIKLPTSDAAANLSTTGILSSTLSTDNTIQTPPSNPAQMTSGNPKFRPLGLRQQSLGIRYTQNLSSQNYLSLLKSLTSNIPSVTIMEDESLAVIFLFEIEEPTKIFLFSKTMLEEKPIMVIYTDAKIDAASARIFTTDGATKTPISEIDVLPIEVNGIIILIKTVGRNFLLWKLRWHQTKTTGHAHITTISHAIENDTVTQNVKENGTTNHVSLVVNSCSAKKCGMIFLGKEECVMLRANTQFLSVTG